MTRNRPKKTPTKIAKKGLPFQELVGSVVQAFDPNAIVKTEQWITGPDGKRDMDVFVQGSVEGSPSKMLIECKDYNPHTTGKVGIEYVDALDSKKDDLQVNYAMICSNSGFTSDAIHKAKRKQIGLISILKAGDPRIKAVIEEEIYTRRIKIGIINTKLYGNCPPLLNMETITYQGLPIINWITKRIILIVSANPMGSAELFIPHRFISPIEMKFAGITGLITGIDLSFPVQTSWFSHVVTIDASLGMYDYIRGKVRLAPGRTQYTINGIDFYNGKHIDFVPRRNELGAGLQPGEFDLDMMLFEKFDMPDSNMIPDLDSHIIQEDLLLSNFKSIE